MLGYIHLIINDVEASFSLLLPICIEMMEDIEEDARVMVARH